MNAVTMAIARCWLHRIRIIALQCPTKPNSERGDKYVPPVHGKKPSYIRQDLEKLDGQRDWKIHRKTVKTLQVVSIYHQHPHHPPPPPHHHHQRFPGTQVHQKVGVFFTPKTPPKLPETSRRSWEAHRSRSLRLTRRWSQGENPKPLRPWWVFCLEDHQENI